MIWIRNRDKSNIHIQSARIYVFLFSPREMNFRKKLEMVWGMEIMGEWKSVPTVRVLKFLLVSS